MPSAYRDYHALMIIGAAFVAGYGLWQFILWIRWRFSVWKFTRMSDAQKRANIDGKPPGFDVLPHGRRE